MSTKDELFLLYSRAEITERIKILAQEIRKDVSGDNELLCVCVLKGAFMFFSDLVRHFGETAGCAFIRLSSYGDKTQTCGTVRQISEFTEDVKGKVVLIVEDIVDSGITAEYLIRYFTELGAASVRLACLIDKPFARTRHVCPDYTAFTLTKDYFVVGFGLDYAQKYRALDAVYYMKENG